MDYFAAFDQNGHIQVIREDTDKNGKIDYIRYFRNSEQYRTERGTDHDGFFESVSFIKNHLIVKTKIDKNKDGRPDIIIFFDRNRKKKKLEWDSDFDGYFETTQIYDDPEWTMIVCQDTNADNITDIRSFYKDQVLMRRELDDNSDGKIDGIEFYGKTGVLRKIKEIKKDFDYTQAMYRSHISIGNAMFYTTTIIMVGFSVLILSNFYPTIYFGLLTGAKPVKNVLLMPCLLYLPLIIFSAVPVFPATS